MVIRSDGAEIPRAGGRWTRKYTRHAQSYYREDNSMISLPNNSQMMGWINLVPTKHLY